MCKAIALLGVSFLLLHLAQAQTLSEYDVKAAYLFNFAKFIELPPADTNTAARPFHVCVVGDDPFGKILDQTLEGESAGSRRISLRRVPPYTAAGCDIAYFSKSVKDLPKALAPFPTGTLTIGDDDDFLRHGGMISFVLDNRRVRFDINLTAVRNGNIRLSSRLMRVARSVLR